MGRSNFIGFKVNAKERQILETIAAREDRTVSDMLRLLIREGAVNRGVFTTGSTKLFSKYEVIGGSHDNEGK